TGRKTNSLRAEDKPQPGGKQTSPWPEQTLVARVSRTRVIRPARTALRTGAQGPSTRLAVPNKNAGGDRRNSAATPRGRRAHGPKVRRPEPSLNSASCF